MQYIYKFYEWTNGTYGTEWTQYVAMPIFIEERLDEQLDTAQVTLSAVPTAVRKAPFMPKTKFRLERYITSELQGDLDNNIVSTPQQYWDYIVDKDEVEILVGTSDNGSASQPNAQYCHHRIHLIEASAVAQGMLVDNIALTYELHDVTLDYRTTISNSDTVGQLGNWNLQNQGAGEARREQVNILFY